MTTPYWLEVLQQVFEVCVIPLLGVATAALVAFIKSKMNETKEKINNELATKYLGLLEQTVVDCIKATNQTYVNTLKGQNAFSADAQKEALEQTTQAILKILSDDAKTYLTNFVGDLDVLIKEKIEANIDSAKK